MPRGNGKTSMAAVLGAKGCTPTASSPPKWSWSAATRQSPHFPPPDPPRVVTDNWFLGSNPASADSGRLFLTIIDRKKPRSLRRVVGARSDIAVSGKSPLRVRGGCSVADIVATTRGVQRLKLPSDLEQTPRQRSQSRRRRVRILHALSNTSPQRHQQIPAIPCRRSLSHRHRPTRRPTRPNSAKLRHWGLQKKSRV
jgi:hypothetical protein